MDKISGILPSNSRITSVDQRETDKTVRRGAPNFIAELSGKVGSASIPMNRGAEAIITKENLGQGQLKDLRGAEIAQKMSEDFFANRLNDIAGPKAAPTYDVKSQIAPQTLGANLDRRA